MGTDGPAAGGAQIARMYEGVRARVLSLAAGGGHGLRGASPRVLLSLLCASAFGPLLAAGAGITAAAAVGGITVLSSVGGGVLSGVLLGVLDRAPRDGEPPGPAPADLEAAIAAEIQRVLAAGGADGQALQAEIAVVLQTINAAGAMVQVTIETSSEQVRGELMAAIVGLGTGIAEMGFLTAEIERSTAQIQRRLDEHGASTRTVIDQNNQQAVDIRLIRERLDALLRDTSAGAAGAAGAVAGFPRTGRAPRCPYRGLLPFEEADAELFYGRERLTAELMVEVAGRLTAGGILVVTGASGAGKSSLLRAGLAPALAQGVQLEGSAGWPRLVMTPSADPLAELAAHLAALGGRDVMSVRGNLARHPEQAPLEVRSAVLADAARRGGGPPGAGPARLVLIVDQFEQVFTLSPGPEHEAGRQAFITALGAAAASPGPGQEPAALVLIAVRGDYWDQCAAYPELAAALRDGQFVVGPMTRSGLRLAITGPAEAAALAVDEGLIDLVVSDLHAMGAGTQAGALPLLSQAMLLTWENREGDRLTVRGYGQAGGVSRAVQTSADAVYDAFPDDQQALARDLLRRMTVAGRDGRLTRRPVARTDLRAAHPEAGRGQVDAVLEALSDRRLLVLDGGDVQISHDAVLEAWPRLRSWLQDDQASWARQGQLADDAREWRDHSGDPAFLYRGSQLSAVQQDAARWRADPGRYPALTATQRAFLDAAQRAAARTSRRRQVIAMTLALLLVASVTGAVVAVAAAASANRQRGIALRQRTVAVSGQLAAESEAIDTADPLTASLLAAAAWRTGRTAQARDSMLDVLAQPERGILAAGGLSSALGISAVAFSPGGKVLAAASKAGPVQLWDLADRSPLGAPLRGGPGLADSVAFSPGGQILAAGGTPGTVRLWSVNTRTELGAPLRAGAGGVTGLAFSPDGRLLATVDDDGTARLWDVATRTEVGGPLSLGASRSAAGAVAFSPDGQVLATAILNGATRLWDVATRTQLGRPLPASGGGAVAVAFSPDGKILAVGNGSAQLWDVGTRTLIGTLLPPGAGVCGVAFSPGGTTLATASDLGVATLWNVATRSPLPGGALAAGTGGVTAVAFSPDGGTLATASQDGTVRLWDTDVYREAGGPLASGSDADTVAFSPDGKYLAAGGDGGVARLWDAATGAPAGPPLAGADDGAWMLAFSPDSKILAIATADGPVLMWDAVTRTQLGPALADDDGGVGAGGLAFSPGGGVLATASGDGQVRLWNVTTHAQIGRSMQIGAGTSDGVAFSPDGKILATAADPGSARLWDVATHAPLGAPLAAGTGGVDLVAFSPDGKTLATAGNGAVRLWNVTSHAQVGRPMLIGAGPVSAMAFSPDGTTLATASADGTAALWDVSTQAQIGSPLAASDVESVAFSPSAAMLATGDGTGSVRLWNISLPGNALGAVCHIAGRSLTRREWNIYAPAGLYRRACP